VLGKILQALCTAFGDLSKYICATYVTEENSRLLAKVKSSLEVNDKLDLGLLSRDNI